MGGNGSGRIGYRPVAEDLLRLDVRRLRQEIVRTLADRVPNSGQLDWPVLRRARVAVHYRLALAENKLNLSVFTSEPIGLADATISLLATAQPFGGQRWWFCCPRCERRAVVLYAVSGAWCCRRCARITYRSSCRSDKRLGLLLRTFEQHWIHGTTSPYREAVNTAIAAEYARPRAHVRQLLRGQRDITLLLKAQGLGLARLQAGRPLYRSQVCSNEHTAAGEVVPQG